VGNRSAGTGYVVTESGREVNSMLGGFGNQVAVLR